MHTVNKIIKDSINTIGIHWSNVRKMYIISMHIIWDIGDIYIVYNMYGNKIHIVYIYVVYIHIYIY